MVRKWSKPVPIVQRIVAAMQRCRVNRREYHDLMRAVFPERDYPNAWRYKAAGGPPGCAMAFGAALRRAEKLGLISVQYSHAMRRRTVVLWAFPGVAEKGSS